MWDVKDGKVELSDIPREFYLNYVGCKVLGLYLHQLKVALFYLNYVGCKASLRSGMPA